MRYNAEFEFAIFLILIVICNCFNNNLVGRNFFLHGSKNGLARSRQYWEPYVVSHIKYTFKKSLNGDNSPKLLNYGDMVMSLNIQIADVDIPVYDGPLSTFEDIESGLSVEDLGLDVMVGESTILNAGRGLFVALSEDIDEITLPKGTPICGYSKGYFSPITLGTRAVAYGFDSPNRGVFYNKELVSLYDVIMKKLPSNITNDPTFSISDVLEGHFVLWNETSKDITIYPDQNYTNRYFIPDETVSTTPGYFGMFANDIAYDENVDGDQYRQRAYEKNIMQIVWRVEFDHKIRKIVPVWPVVIINRDLKFTNYLPMEVGLTYTWKYWEAARILANNENPTVAS